MDRPSISTNLVSFDDAKNWNKYVLAHPQGTLYHLIDWCKVIQDTYKHKIYCLLAIQNKGTSSKAQNGARIQGETSGASVLGILPLVHMKHFLFGHSLVSIPFFDMGGVLASDKEVEDLLLMEAIRLGEKLGVNTIELRQAHQLACGSVNNLEEPSNIIHHSPFTVHNSQFTIHNPPFTIHHSPFTIHHSPFTIHNHPVCVRSHKVRMLLELPDSSETLMRSFKSKLRSQIKKPIKEGLTAKIGGSDLLYDFYEVFAVNMRDLGSPVHSKKMMRNTLKEFSREAKIIIVYKESEPVACSLVVGFRDVLENPWASALRKYSRLAPNMLLYWTMLEYACDNGYKYFDFGRSTPGEGTYRFKKQWGAKPAPLYWYYVGIDGRVVDPKAPEKSKFDSAIRLWQKLPVPLTKLIGPSIRKHIGL